MRTVRSMPGSAIAVACLLVVQACSGSGDTYTERVVGGVLERTYEVDVPPQIAPYEVVPATTFGSGQGEESYFLVRPQWMAEGPAGSLYIYDQAERAIHRFNADGEHIGAFGRRGSGPGEFMVLHGMHFVEGELHTYDPNLRRLSIFSPSGELLEMRPTGADLPRSTLVLSRDNRKNQRFMGVGTQTSVSRVEIRSRFTLFMLDEELEPVTALIDSSVVTPSLLLADRPFVSPFKSTWFLTAFRPGQPVAWTLGEVFRIEILDPANNEAHRLIVRRHRRPITSAQRETVAGQYAQVRLVEAARRALLNETHLPQISDLQWDAQGRLWVQAYALPTDTSRSIHADVWPFKEYEEGVFQFDVFDRIGTWLFQQSLPGNPGLIGEDRLYIAAESPEGAPIIRSYALIERGR